MTLINTSAIRALLILGLISACASPQGELRVLSYNIRHGADINWKMRLGDQAEFIASRNADLISLQEVDEHCGRSNNVDEAHFIADRTATNAVFQSFMDYDGGRYGIAALIKYPLTRIEPKFYTAGTEPRNFPLCHFKLGGREVLFVPLHLDWVSDDTIRLKQAQELIADVDELGLAVILAGDFNAQPRSATMQLFTDAGFSFAVDKAYTFHGNKGTEYFSEIDFIAIRSSADLKLELLKTITIEQRELSDHAPVEAQLKWQVL